VAVPASVLLDKPTCCGGGSEGCLSWHAAACLPISFMTAWHMLFARGRLKPGETVLIHSAGSGVSHGAIQMAHMIGARVITTTSSPVKAEHARQLGADEAINYINEDVGKRVGELTGGRGVDVILDHNGAVTWQVNIQSLARGGRLVFCGVTQGAKVTFDLGTFFYRAQSILGSTLGRIDELMQVIKLTAAGCIKPVIDRVFPLSEIRQAHEYLTSPHRFGKVVIEIAP